MNCLVLSKAAVVIHEISGLSVLRFSLGHKK